MCINIFLNKCVDKLNLPPIATKNSKTCCIAMQLKKQNVNKNEQHKKCKDNKQVATTNVPYS
jgi:hypothetical protein